MIWTTSWLKFDLCASSHVHTCSVRFSSTLSSPFHPTSSSSHSSSISCTSSCTSSTTLRAVVTLRTSLERRWTLLTNPTSSQPKNYDLMETCVESFTESLTTHTVSEQRFLEDVDYDDTALKEMLHNAHQVHVYHSQREGLSVGQSSSSVSERTGRPVEERTGRPVMVSGQELNVGNAPDRKSESSPNVRRRLRNTIFRLIMTEEVCENWMKLLSLSRKKFIAFKQKNFNDEINNFLMNS